MTKLLKTSLLTLLLISISLTSFSQEKKGIYKGFSGGMFLHTGFINITPNYSPNYNINGYLQGIGGKLALSFTDYFYIGTEGYGSKCTYDKLGSYINFGWGGLLFETGYKFWKIRPFAGITIGGGHVSHLHVLSGNQTDNLQDIVIYKSFATMVYAPYFGVEYHFGKRLAFTLKTDFLRSFDNQILGGNNTGARIYFGILFRKHNDK